MIRRPPSATRTDTLFPYTTLFRSIADQGTTFANAFVTSPLCCPSRVSILRGQYARNTGIVGNAPPWGGYRSEEHTSELQSLMRISYAVLCLEKKNNHKSIAQKLTTQLRKVNNPNTRNTIHSL